MPYLAVATMHTSVANQTVHTYMNVSTTNIIINC